MPKRLGHPERSEGSSWRFDLLPQQEDPSLLSGWQGSDFPIIVFY
jgi:hypothetical protein